MSREIEREKSDAGNYQVKPRYRQRIRIKVPVMFTSGSHVGKGQIVDLTIPGCLIDSPVAVLQGQSLHLELLLPGFQFPLSVTLAVVRWTKGRRFGVEFIKMHQSEQRILQRFVVQHCSDLSTKVGEDCTLRRGSGEVGV